MIVFISHKAEDSQIAGYICNELKRLRVQAYLDTLEGNLLLDGEALTGHIKERLNACTDLLAVVSNKTQASWWVPFEIGMAAQRDFPIVTYLVNDVTLPDYLSYWPKLTKTTDLYKYVSAKTQAINEATEIRKLRTFSKQSETGSFYRKLKGML